MTISATLPFVADVVPTTAISATLPFVADVIPTTATSNTLPFTGSFSLSRVAPKQIRESSTPGFLLQFDAGGRGVLRRARCESVTVAGIGAAGTAAQVVYVTDETGGPTLAFSDGTIWRRWQDRAQVT